MNKFATALLPVVLAACSSTPVYDQKFGDAVREARVKMTINPDAGKNADTVAGMDGRAAKETITLYQETFKAPPPVVNVINIGGQIGTNK